MLVLNSTRQKRTWRNDLQTFIGQVSDAASYVLRPWCIKIWKEAVNSLSMCPRGSFALFESVFTHVDNVFMGRLLPRWYSAHPVIGRFLIWSQTLQLTCQSVLEQHTESWIAFDAAPSVYKYVYMVYSPDEQVAPWEVVTATSEGMKVWVSAKLVWV